jgi:hypothetical protein
MLKFYSMEQEITHYSRGKLIASIKRRDNITNNHEHKDAKVVIKSRTSKGRQYHGQNRQKKSTDNDMKNTAQATRTP